MNIMNKFFMKTTTLVLILGILILGSCTEDEESGIATVGVKMQAVTSVNSLATSGRVLNTISFTEALVGVTELELETLEDDAMDDAEDDDEIEFEGRFIVDLIAGVSDPDFGFTELPAGLYEELEIEMEPILEGGHTIYVAFEFTPEGGTEPVSVIYTYDDELEFELESESGFMLDGTGINQLLVLLDLDALLAGIDLSNALAGDDGVIRINGESNAEIASKFESNLDKILEAGEDDDDDGEFDDDDDDHDDDQK